VNEKSIPSPLTRRPSELFVTAVAAIALAVGGCHVNQPYQSTPPTVADKALEVLKSLPSFEDTQSQVQAAIGQITAAASQLIPTINWETLNRAQASAVSDPTNKPTGRDICCRTKSQRTSMSQSRIGPRYRKPRKAQPPSLRPPRYRS
jgi:hypothetical protein